MATQQLEQSLSIREPVRLFHGRRSSPMGTNSSGSELPDFRSGGQRQLTQGFLKVLLGSQLEVNLGSWMCACLPEPRL